MDLASADAPQIKIPKPQSDLETEMRDLTRDATAWMDLASADAPQIKIPKPRSDLSHRMSLDSQQLLR